MAAGQNGSCGPAGRRHYHEDRKRLEEAQHAPALPGAAPLTVLSMCLLLRGFILISKSVDGDRACGVKAASCHFAQTHCLQSTGIATGQNWER